MSAERLVLIPPEISPSSLRGARSGLAVRVWEGESMGTTWRLRHQLPRGFDAERARDAVAGALALVVAQMSHWDPDSDLSRFNRAPAGSWHPLPPEFLEVLGQAMLVARDSDGACDPTLGKIVDLHGFGPPGPADPPPDPESLERARAEAGWQRLRIEDGRALQPGGCTLDLSSIAKGYAVDLASRALLELGLDDFVLELGGELRGHGCRPDGQPWWISVDTPEGLPEPVVALCGISLATSGVSVRQRRIGENETSHLIDPATGSATVGDVLAVTVLSGTCVEADAWATAFHVAGPDRGPRLADTLGIAAIFTIRRENGFRRHLSEAAARMTE